ncbi:hypothetical protein BB561_000817 [Smittium simulii]|uniref:RGS domain-containing protein n=1 Tax=Smittium simulii TaxID=133385 RepID=A0A2T9YXE3_9FUNG|nr:hypothetical protein BB561_000817 [Smittium simulii]
MRKAKKHKKINDNLVFTQKKVWDLYAAKEIISDERKNITEIETNSVVVRSTAFEPQNQVHQADTYNRNCLKKLGNIFAKEKEKMNEIRIQYYVFLYVLFSFSVYVIIQIFTKDFSLVSPLKKGCKVSVWEYYPIFGILGFLFTFVFPVLMILIWDINDAYGIKMDIIISMVCILAITLLYIVGAVFEKSDPNKYKFFFIIILLDISQVTAVIIPLSRAIIYSKAKVQSHNLARQTSLESFFLFISDEENLKLLRTYSVSKFCSELVWFFNEYKYLKAITKREFSKMRKVCNIKEYECALNNPSQKNRKTANFNQCTTVATTSKQFDSTTANTSNISSSESLQFSRLESIMSSVTTSKEPLSLQSIASKKGVRDQDIELNQNMSSFTSKQPQACKTIKPQSKHGIQDISLSIEPTKIDVCESKNKQKQVMTEFYKDGAYEHNLDNFELNELQTEADLDAFVSAPALTIRDIILSIPGLAEEFDDDITFRVPEQLSNNYLRFYKLFICDTAEYEINMCYQVKASILEKVHSKTYTIDMFDRVYNTVLYMLYENVFKPYIYSST